MQTHARRTARLLAPAVLALLAVVLGACHLIDQRDFTPGAGKKPQPPAAPLPAPPAPALVTIRFDTPTPAYGIPLARAVARALAVKPNVTFLIEAATANAGQTPAAIAAGQDVARVVRASGAARGQIEQSVAIDPALTATEVRVRLR